MTWVKLTDGFPEDPRIEHLSDRAFRFHVTALCYCARNLTDGYLTPKAATLTALVAGYKKPDVLVDELVTAGLWTKNGEGWWIPKFLDYNQSAEEVREARAKARQRMRDKRNQDKQDS